MTKIRKPVAARPIPPGIAADITEFKVNLAAYLDGRMDPDEFKRFRLARGIYGQRQPGVQMVRIKIPYGFLTTNQFRRIAEVAEDYATGISHVTTRQDIQLHYVPLEDVPEVLTRLGEVGLTTREACGNSVRNVTSCPFAGVCRTQVFDVTPYAHALAYHLMRHPVCQWLPRKFKPSFSGCETDCGVTYMHDLGFIAQKRTVEGQQKRGFRVMVGGGTGHMAIPAQVLYDFVPEEKFLAVAEAVLMVFDRDGQRKNRRLARIKFHVKQVGIEAFRAEVEKALPACTAPLAPPVSYVEDPLEEWTFDVAATAGGDASFEAWLRQNAHAQRQAGKVACFVTLPLGDIDPDQAFGLCDLVDELGDGTLRTTATQNLFIRNLSVESLRPFYDGLRALNLHEPGAGRLTDVLSCPGLRTCNLSFTRSRGLAAELSSLFKNGNGAFAGIEDAAVKVSGCYNGCGQHHIATLGFFGFTKKIHGKPMPFYQLWLGGGPNETTGQYGKPVTGLPARLVPEAVRRIVDHYKANRREGESFARFLQRTEKKVFKALLSDLETPPPEELTEEVYKDWGADAAYEEVLIGESECQA